MAAAPVDAQLVDQPPAPLRPAAERAAIHRNTLAYRLHRLEQRTGWRLADPQDVAGEPEDFRCYVNSSSGEFSVAKHAYVATRSHASRRGRAAGL